MNRPRPLVLLVLDGWGCSEQTHGNAIAAAKKPHWDRFLETYPWTTLEASGEAVGLPKGIMGNSEVGHMNLGSGRVVPQGLVVINHDVESGAFAKNNVLWECIEHVKDRGTRLHFMGLLSDGCVHSSIAHLLALIDAAQQADVPHMVHPFLDGRDVPPRSAEAYLARLSERLRHGRGQYGAISGRYYAMDRDKRWERTQLAYDAMLLGKAQYHAPSAIEALHRAYARGESDEFVAPTIVGEPRSLINDGDAVIFFNFRPDRARQMTLAFSNAHFNEFPVRAIKDTIFATMTKYEEDFSNPVLFGPHSQEHTFGQILSEHDFTQLRLAETEKYAHVTYFFNGGREEVFPGEDRKLIPSDRTVATYDLAPQMKAGEITDAALEAIASRNYDAIVMNLANADMVGHTGRWEPTVEAVELLDACMGRIERAVLDVDGVLAITADHGNAEAKIDPNGKPLTAHTTNRVPLVIIANKSVGELQAGGKLGDVAPTLLHVMGLRAPHQMTGTDLIAAAHCALT